MNTEFDVVVVGGGGAGLMAALSAARLGRRVALLEKCPRLGGTTGLSVGTISAAATPHQRALGILDTPDAHFEDMGKFAGPLQARDNLALRRLFVEHVPETIRLLTDLGIVPHSRGYIHHLARACRRAGVVMRTGAPARRLVMDAGRVRGVEAGAEHGDAIVFGARQGVILASGDFSAAPPAYKERFLAPILRVLDGINPASTGDGQRLGEAAGGEVVNGDLVWGPEIRFVAPPRPGPATRIPPFRFVARTIRLAMGVLPDAVLRPLLMSFATTFLAPSHELFRKGAILVNAEGRRFGDERDRPQDRIGFQPGQKAYILFDAAVAEKFRAWPDFVSTAPVVGYAYLPDYERSRRDICFRADSWEELGARMKLDGRIVADTVAAYNAEAARSKDEARPPLLRPPFFAMGPAKAWIVFSEGGLRVDEKLRVLRANSREPIPGLYAAGSCGQGGLILEGHGHHLGWAFTSGRLAGRQAAFAEPAGAAEALR